MILDIHSHRNPPYPEGIISVNLTEQPDFQPVAGQFYSLGIHPWSSGNPDASDFLVDLEKYAGEEWCLAIGETGIDTVKGGPLFRQIQLFKKQIEISESLGKPLIIHDVKAHDIILGLHKEIQPRQPWIIHGFRAKPGVAKMLTDKGIYLSFGEKFNTDSIRVTPPELICAETDESTLPIETIISSLSAASPQPLLPIITDNHARLFIKR